MTGLHGRVLSGDRSLIEKNRSRSLRSRRRDGSKARLEASRLGLVSRSQIRPHRNRSSSLRGRGSSSSGSSSSLVLSSISVPLVILLQRHIQIPALVVDVVVQATVLAAALDTSDKSILAITERVLQEGVPVALDVLAEVLASEFEWREGAGDTRVVIVGLLRESWSLGEKKGRAVG